MNPLFQASKKPQISSQMIKGLKSYMKSIQMAQNPNMALTALSQQNPQLKEVMDLCKGKDPKAVFEERCRAMGYDPEEIVNLLM